MIASKKFDKAIQNRYVGWDTTFGKKVENGQLGFAELEAYTIKNGEPQIQSGRQELLENLLNEYL
jgi:xylose isomerase